MTKNGHDFLDVMSGENDRGTRAASTEAIEEMEKVFAGRGVQTGAGFVQDEQRGFGN